MQENNSTAGRIPKEEFRLDLYSVLNDIKNQWISVLLLTVAAILLSYVMLSATGKSDYATRATIAVRYSDEDPNVNNAMIPDVNLAIRYAGDAAKNLKTILTRSDIASAIGKHSGSGRLRGKIDAETIADSNLLVIKVVAGAPGTSMDEMQAILNYLTESKDELLGGIDISVVQEPRLTEESADKGKIRNYSIIIGAVILVLLCTLLGWSSSLRYTVRNSAEVMPKLGTKLLAVIPQAKNKASSLLITDPSVAPGFSEEVRSLAVRLMNEMSDEGKKVLLVSGAAEGEGKSTAAANIALAMSQMNRRVILADMDFRNPSLGKILNMQENETTDLIKFLENGAKDTGSANLNGLIRPVSGTELSAVLTGKAAPLAVDRYAEQIRNCLELLRNRADFVIVDAGSAGAVSDVEVLTSMADATAIVVREHFTEVPDLEKAIDVLSRGGRMLGCVFNNARKNAISADATEFGNGGHYVG